MSFALGWAASAHGPTAAGLVVTAVVAPRTVLLLLGGAVGDRYGPRTVMITGDSTLLVSTSVLAVLVLDVGTPLWLLLAAAAVEGVVTAFSAPASGAMPRHLVEDQVLPRAVGLRQAATQVAELVGGPVGGLLVGVAGMAAVAGTYSLTFAALLVVLVVVRPVRTIASAPARPLLRQALEGWSTTMGTPVLRTAVLMTGAAAGLVLPVSTVLLPVLVREQGWPPTAGGLTLGAQAAGALTVALVISRWGTSRRAGSAAAAGLGVVCVGLVLLAAAAAPGAAVASGVVVGAGLSVFVGHLTPLVLTRAPQTHLSRVQAVLGLAQATALLASASLVGAAAAALGAPTTIAACAGLLAVVIAGALLSTPFRRAGGPVA